jgi:hypothetical protein
VLFLGGRRELGCPAVVADTVGEGVDVVIMSRVFGDSIAQWTPFATLTMCSPMGQNVVWSGADAEWRDYRPESDKLLSNERWW